jgi:predicted HTH domain antitoxin
MMPADLPLEYDLWFRAVRRSYLIRLLSEAHGQKCRAARLAQVHRNMIQRMLDEENISGEDIRRIKLQTQIRNGASANV